MPFTAVKSAAHAAGVVVPLMKPNFIARGSINPYALTLVKHRLVAFQITKLPLVYLPQFSH